MTWPVIINGFGICYMLHVCVCSPVISHARKAEKCKRFLGLSFVSLMQAIA